MTKRGKMAMTVCSSAFLTLGRAQARALGNAELPIVEIPHPFGGRARADVRTLAEQCAAEIARRLAGGQA